MYTFAHDVSLNRSTFVVLRNLIVLNQDLLSIIADLIIAMYWTA